MIIICLILSLLFLYGFLRFNYTRKNLIKLNEKTKQQNEELAKANEILEAEFTELNIQRDTAERDLKMLNTFINQSQDYLNRTQANTEQALQKHLEYYCDALEQAYKDAEDRHDKAVAQLAKAYQDFELKNKSLMELEQHELDKLKATRRAALEAQIREEEIKNKLEFYCLTPKVVDINDIRTLEGIKCQLNNPRILSMLIWSTYFQKDMTTLCNRILGLNTVTGIYKITNQINNKCYIGQSVDVSKRWKDHAKCGLGIDAPVGNKLYKDMQEIGIWNFSWELLETCPREQLNEKEKYYIELYQSQDFGYNSTKGNK